MKSSTKELCARLDELGVRYTTDDSNDYEIIEWQGPYNLWWQFVYDPYEEEPYGELRLLDAGGSTHLTPEQAVAATVEPNKTKEWRSVALGLFDSLEKADLEVAKRWLCENDLLGQEIAYGDAKAATVGAGTCHMEVHDNLDESEGMGDVWLECDACHWQMMLEPTTPRFKHCPNCTRRVVSE